MGACNSSDEWIRDRDIQREMKNERSRDEKMHKLLLLGAGESGKSTLFKQMISIYGRGFTTKELSRYTPVIHGNTIRSMQTLIRQSQKRSRGGSKYDEKSEDRDRFSISTDLNMIRDAVINAKRNSKGTHHLTPKLAGYIHVLWKDPGIRATYEKRAEFQLSDSADFFFDNVRLLTGKDYIPTEEQMLRARVRTTGISETRFMIEKTTFRMVDVGGQRSERKKWLKCFEGVTCVIFVAAMSTYNQVLFEDEKTNRMMESLNLFEETVNSNWFKRTAMILFLNKSDLFRKKLKSYPITLCPVFENYQGDPKDEEQAITSIREAFMCCNCTPTAKNPTRIVYTHVTCATNKRNVTNVFLAVKDTVLKENLKMAGLMVSLQDGMD